MGFMRTAIITTAAVALFSSIAAHSQVRALESPPGDLKLKPAEAPKAAPAPAGPDTTTETFGDWSILCAAPAAGASDRSCEVDTTLTLRGQSAPFARIAFVRAAKDKPTHIIAIVPVNVSNAAGVKIESDPGKSEIDLPFKSCVPAGCVAEAELTKDQLQGFHAPTKTAGQITLVDASGKSATVQFSLRGVDQALDSFFKRQEK
jgi:invasion protein IalB